ncbi:MAG TPA: hypothetical protein VGQ13_07775 [Nitrososphaera sp.]|nr:hypothetical protein [Nitrososphaera sp.]
MQSSPKITNGASTTIVMLTAAFGGGLLISILLAGFIFKEPEVTTDGIVVMNPETAFEEGYTQHLVYSQFSQDTIQVKRGATITIPFTITHKSHSLWQWVTVSNFQQNVGNHVHGKYVEVDIKGISPSSAIIWPNSSVQEEITLSIPSSAPDDIVGKSVTISMQFDTEVAFGGSYRGRADSINLQVVA